MHRQIVVQHADLPVVAVEVTPAPAQAYSRDRVAAGLRAAAGNQFGDHDRGAVRIMPQRDVMNPGRQTCRHVRSACNIRGRLPVRGTEDFPRAIHDAEPVVIWLLGQQNDVQGRSAGAGVIQSVECRDILELHARPYQVLLRLAAKRRDQRHSTGTATTGRAFVVMPRYHTAEDCQRNRRQQDDGNHPDAYGIKKPADGSAKPCRRYGTGRQPGTGRRRPF